MNNNNNNYNAMYTSLYIVNYYIFNVRFPCWYVLDYHKSEMPALVGFL